MKIISGCKIASWVVFKIFNSITAIDIKFTIKNKQLESLEFHRMFGSHNISGIPGYGSKEKIKSIILLSEDINFDAVTGASRSSSFAKAAIKDAILKGPETEK